MIVLQYTTGPKVYVDDQEKIPNVNAVRHIWLTGQALQNVQKIDKTLVLHKRDNGCFTGVEATLAAAVHNRVALWGDK